MKHIIITSSKVFHVFDHLQFFSDASQLQKLTEVLETSDALGNSDVRK